MSSRNCPACGTALEADAVRCPGCRKVFGDANRCEACQAVAAVIETAPARYVCAACGKPRTRRRGTVIDSDFADELVRRARTQGLLGLLLRLAAVGLAALGASASGLQALFDLGHPALTMGVFVVAAAGLFVLGGRLRARRAALLGQALQRRLVSEASKRSNGVTVDAASRALAESHGEVDAVFTRLARAGELEMDVDDAGTIRYRVAVDDLEDPTEIIEELQGAHKLE